MKRSLHVEAYRNPFSHLLWFSSRWYDYQYNYFGNIQREGINFHRLSEIICIHLYPLCFEVALLKYYC